MKELSTDLEVFTQLRIEKIVPATIMTPSYPDLIYQCGCGEAHKLETTLHLLCARPVQFFFSCENEVVTLVRVKGFFRKKVEEKWFTSFDTFKLAVSKLQNMGILYS